MSRLTTNLRAWVRRVNRQPAAVADPTPIDSYLAAGRKPWEKGYLEYRDQFSLDVLRNSDIMRRFRMGQPLPAEYGARLDERVVEYPWVLSHLADQPGNLLDAGATFGYRYLLDLPVLSDRSVHICSLTYDTKIVVRPNVSYTLADLRQAPVLDACLNNIVCISTLEHVGMDNTQVYYAQENFRENRPDSYRAVVKEFQRMLAPGGHLYLTVPYGAYEQHGWLQQFDEAMVADVIHVFGGQLEELAFYRYSAEGWQLAAAAECSTAHYFDIHHHKEYDPDYAAAARAVACLDLVKTLPTATPSRGE